MPFLLLLIFSLFITGCQEEESAGSVKSEANLTAKVVFGALADAEVKIFRVESDYTKTLLFTEKTQNAAEVEDIGTFNPHESELDNDTYYIYQVSGGTDYDVDSDGIKDITPTESRAVLRAAVKGEWLQSQAKFHISALSEMVYTRVIYSLYPYYFTRATKKIVKKDINNDGEINYLDVLTFEESNQSALSKAFKIRYPDFKKVLRKAPRFASALFMPSVATLIKSTATPQKSRVTQNGEWLFSVEKESTLAVYDVNETNRSKEVTRFDTPLLDTAVDLVLTEDETRLFVVTGLPNSQLLLFDVSKPSFPSLIFETPIAGDATSVAYEESERLLFVTDAINGLTVYDCLDENNLTVFTHNSTFLNAKKVIVGKDKAVITHAKTGFSIVETSSKNFSTLSTLDTQEANGALFLKGGNYLAIADHRYLRLYDIRESNLIKEVGVLPMQEVIEDFSLSSNGRYLFVASGTFGVEVVDLYTISNPKVIATIPVDSKALGLSLYNDELLYVSDEKGVIEVVDVTFLRHRFHLDRFALEGAKSIARSSDHTKLAVGTKQGLYMIDTTSVYALYQLSFNSFTLLSDLLYNSSNEEVYAAAGKKGLLSANISDFGDVGLKRLFSPLEADLLVDTGEFTGVVSSVGLQLLDIDNEELVSKYSLLGIRDVFYQNNIFYVARESDITVLSYEEGEFSVLDRLLLSAKRISYSSHNGNLYIFDQKNRLHFYKDTLTGFKKRASITFDQSIEGMIEEASGSFLYLFGANRELKIIDVREDRFEVVTSIKLLGDINDFVLSSSGTLGYAAVDRYGVRVLYLNIYKEIY